MILFHFHPKGPSPVLTPHLHLGEEFGERYRRMHVPTGVLSLALVIRFFIEEVGVDHHRPDWSDVLNSLDV